MPFRQTAFFGALLALAAGVLFSFGSVTVRASPDLDSFQYLFWRSFGVILPVLAMAWRQRVSPLAQIRASGWLGLAGGACLAAAALLFIYAMKQTTVANALLFASGAPLLGAVLARVVLREPIAPMTVVAIGLGVAGLLIMTGGEIGGGDMFGNLASFGSAIAYALYSIVVRVGRSRDLSGVLTDYAVLTALICAAVMLAQGSGFATSWTQNGFAFLHGVIFIGGGLICFNLAARLVAAGKLTLLAQTETILGPIWVFLIFNERPNPTTVIGGMIVLAGVMLAAVWEARASRRAGIEDAAEVYR